MVFICTKYDDKGMHDIQVTPMIYGYVSEYSSEDIVY